MTLNFKPLGVNDEESGYIGVISCFFSCVVALTVSYFTDRLKKHIKVCIIHCITSFIIIIIKPLFKSLIIIFIAISDDSNHTFTLTNRKFFMVGTYMHQDHNLCVRSFY